MLGTSQGVQALVDVAHAHDLEPHKEVVVKTLGEPLEGLLDDLRVLVGTIKDIEVSVEPSGQNRRERCKGKWKAEPDSEADTFCLIQ